MTMVHHFTCAAAPTHKEHCYMTLLHANFYDSSSTGSTLKDLVLLQVSKYVANADHKRPCRIFRVDLEV